MNENLANEIRKTIENVKVMKEQASGINNYLNILEGMIRADYQKQVDEAYQRGYDKGYADKTNNDKVGKELAKDIYQRGLNDAWEAARKLFSSMADSDIEKAFPTEWNNGGFHALINLQPQEAIEKLKAYEEEQSDKIEVGDEVTHKSDSVVWTAVCIQIDEDGRHMNLMGHTGAVGYYLVDAFKKTGRHFDIGKILEAMKHD